MIIQVATSPTVCFCTTYKIEQSKYALKLQQKWNEQQKSINFISPDLWFPTAPTSVRLLTMFAVTCSRESIGCCLWMSMNSRSDWLKSGAEHHRHCYQWMEKTSARLYSRTKGRYFEYLLSSSWTTGQLNKLLAKVTEIWKMCFMSVILIK